MLLRRLRPWLGALPLGFRDLLSGSFWLILAAGWSQGSMLLANLIVANLLGVSDYGRFALLQSSVITFSVLAQAGFGVVIAQQVSSFHRKDAARTGEIVTFCFVATLVFSLVCSLGLFFSRGLLAQGLFRDEGLVRGIALAAFALPWLALSYVQQGLFSGLERFRDQTRISFSLSPLVLLLPSLGAFWGGYEGAMLGLGIAYLLRVLLTHLVLSRLLRAEKIGWLFRNLRSSFHIISRLAMPTALSGTIAYIAIWGGQTLLVRVDGGHAVLGLFAAAFTVKTMVMFVPTQMTGVLLPLLSRLNGRFSMREWRNLLLVNLVATLTVTSSLAAVGILFATNILSLFGTDFIAGKSTLIILLLAAPVEAISVSLYQALQSQGRFWRSTLQETVPKALTVLILAALLIPDYLADGLAIAWLLGWLVGLAGLLLALKPWSAQPAWLNAPAPQSGPLLREDGAVG